MYTMDDDDNDNVSFELMENGLHNKLGLDIEHTACTRNRNLPKECHVTPDDNVCSQCAALNALL